MVIQNEEEREGGDDEGENDDSGDGSTGASTDPPQSEGEEESILPEKLRFLPRAFCVFELKPFVSAEGYKEPCVLS